MTPALSEKRLRRLTKYIAANLDRKITLSDLAEIAAMSPFHFSRTFTDAAGMPPMAYVRRVRVDCAAALLRDEPGLSIAEIAGRCGFSSQSHFTTVFKQETGMTPAQFRQRSGAGTAP